MIATKFVPQIKLDHMFLFFNFFSWCLTKPILFLENDHALFWYSSLHWDDQKFVIMWWIVNNQQPPSSQLPNHNDVVCTTNDKADLLALNSTLDSGNHSFTNFQFRSKTTLDDLIITSSYARAIMKSLDTSKAYVFGLISVIVTKKWSAELAPLSFPYSKINAVLNLTFLMSGKLSLLVPVFQNSSNRTDPPKLLPH